MGSIPGSRRSLQKEMATNSSILVWEISWTEETDERESMGLRDRGTNTFTFTWSVQVTTK